MKRTIALTAIALLLPIWLLAQNSLTVRVKDENGKPLVGASIKIKGSLLSGQTNSRGEIQLKNLTDGQHVLSVSFLGFQSQERHVMLPQNSTVELVLGEESFLADEVIVQ